MKTKQPRLVLVTCILASSLAFIDGSVVNVGLPAIGAALHAKAVDLQWVVNAYLLPLSALLLLGGAAGDRYGKRNLLVGGTALFALASVLCALAPSLPLLLAGRALQGIGAALLMPNSLSILGSSFAGEEKGRAIGIWAAVGAAAAAIGPVLGGWLIDIAGWRTIFTINLPVAVAAIVMALIAVRGPKSRERAPIDVLGALFATAGLGVATWGLTMGSGAAGWTTAAIAAATGGVALLVAFLWAERCAGDRAMMPLALFSSRDFVGLSLLTLLLYGALGGLFVLLPYLLIVSAHYRAAKAGAALLPLPIILTIASPLMGRLAARIGPRLPLTIGPLVVAGGFLLALRVSEQANYVSEVLPMIVVIAIGMAGAVAPLTTAVLGSVDAQHTGSASGLNSALARTGGLVATALLGSILGARGAALIGDFHIAAITCAAAALGASVSALLIARKR